MVPSLHLRQRDGSSHVQTLKSQCIHNTSSTSRAVDYLCHHVVHCQSGPRNALPFSLSTLCLQRCSPLRSRRRKYALSMIYDKQQLISLLQRSLCYALGHLAPNIRWPERFSLVATWCPYLRGLNCGFRNFNTMSWFQYSKSYQIASILRRIGFVLLRRPRWSHLRICRTCRYWALKSPCWPSSTTLLLSRPWQSSFSSLTLVSFSIFTFH